jgi:hypothetical protein
VALGGRVGVRVLAGVRVAVGGIGVLVGIAVGADVPWMSSFCPSKIVLPVPRLLSFCN